MPFTKRYGPILGRFADFSQGEYGALSGRHANPGQWSGINCFVYLDHSIGPRPAVKQVSPSFVAGPGNFPVRLVAFGHGEDIAVAFGIDAARECWWTADPFGSDSWHKFAGSPLVHTTVLGIDWIEDGLNVYVSNVDDTLYVLDLNAHSVTALTGAPAGGRAITVFGEHLVTGGATGTGRMLQWSDPNNFNSWPALNFLNIGHPNDVIESFQVQKGVLVVTMKDGSIYQISGTLGVNETVRRFSSPAPRAPSIITPRRVGQDKRSRIWRRGRVWEPESFDGATIASIPQLNDWQQPDADDVCITAGAQLDDVCFVGALGGTLIQHHGAWTRHVLGQVTTEPVDPILAYYDGNETLVICQNDPVQVPQFIALDLDIERPPMVSQGDTVVEAGSVDPPAASFTTPEVRDSAGRGINVRDIIVRFTKYRTGLEQTNHFDLTVNNFDVYELETPAPNVIVDAFDEDNALVADTPDGVRQQMTFGLDNGGDVSAVSVTISNLRGVKIDEILLFGGIEPARSES